MTTPAQYSAFGRWLKQRRTSLRLTQHAFAQQVGCTASMLQKIEQGVRRPSPAMIEQLADVLGIALEERTAMHQLAGHQAGNGWQEAAPSFRIDQPATAPAHAMLLTKIQPPPLSRQTILRPRLTSQLHGDYGGLTLVVAPAGWGKTTLLASWIASMTHAMQHVAWITLDERDTDVILVLRYIITALQQQCPGLGDTALQLLNTPQPTVESALTLLINNLTTHDMPLVLLLDDYHLVRAPAIHHALTYLIEYLPPRVHLVIASREDPSFSLSRLRAQQRLHEIRAADLRFTGDEIAAFCADVMGLGLDKPDIVALEQRTEGWITGLQLAALAIREYGDRTIVHSFTGTHRHVLDYLTEEVLTQLPPHLHEFLLQTSILDRLCGPLCDAVMGIEMDSSTPDQAIIAPPHPPSMSDGRPTTDPHIVNLDAYSQLLLDELERANLFLAPLDDQHIWYRYHHLFGEVLRQRLQRGASPAMIMKLHERAASWFATHGLLLDAIHHALAAQQWQRAAAWIEQNGDVLLQIGATNHLKSMIMALPPAVRQQHPRMVYLLGLCERQVWSLEAARRLFEQAADLFRVHGDAAGRGESLIYVADCYRMLGAVAPARAALTEALASPLPATRRAVAVRSRAYECVAAGDWQQAIASLDEAITLIGQTGNQQALTELAVNLRSMLLFLPGGKECTERLCRMIEYVPIVPQSLLQATSIFLHATTHLQRGELHAAYTGFKHTTQLNNQLGPLSQLSFDATTCLMRCAGLVGDTTVADEQAEHLLTMLNHPSVAVYRHRWGAAHLAQIGWLRWAQGRFDSARTIMAEADALESDQEWPGVKLNRRLLRSLVALADGNFNAAEAILRAAYTDQQHLRDSVAFADAGVLLAYTYLGMKRDIDAATILNAALAQHEQHATPGLLLLAGERIVGPLLHFALTHTMYPDFATETLRLLHAALPQSPAAPGPMETTPDRLTRREQDVLRLIATGASNAEIAERLIISMATVKKHINAIYAKLHAANRTQALIRAQERGLV